MTAQKSITNSAKFDAARSRQIVTRLAICVYFSGSFCQMLARSRANIVAGKTIRGSGELVRAELGHHHYRCYELLQNPAIGDAVITLKHVPY